MIFFSVSSIQAQSIGQIFKGLADAGVQNIELNGTNGYDSDIENTLEEFKERYNLKFLIHNYFPPPKDAFVLNLASLDKDILHQTIIHAKRAVRLAGKLKIPVYSVHAGMRLDPHPAELGKQIKQISPVPYEQSYEIFVRSLTDLCDFARDFNVDIAVENHVLSPFNLKSGRNDLCLICEADEFLRLFKDVRCPNLKALVDLGHLNITSRTLGFDKIDFINKLKDNICVFHLHHNDGVEDTHEMINDQDWFWEALGKFKDRCFVVESHNLTPGQISKAYEICRRRLF